MKTIPIGQLNQFEQEAYEDSRGAMKMLAWDIILIVTLIIVAVAYFGGRGLYYWGYSQGQANFVVQRHHCQQFAERCDFSKTSSYPRKVK